METIRLGSVGPEVKLLQRVLNNIGYNAGIVDGIFGQQTKNAVIIFQRSNGLTPDGIVGAATWQSLDKFIRGYDIYTVRTGDTIYNIARRYYTAVNSIISANPGINPNVLSIGQRLIIPYGTDVVLTDIDYTYDILQRNIDGLKARYPFLEIGTAGSSVMGKNLYYIRIGQGPNKVFYNASHHGNEWITTPLLMKFLENYCRALTRGTTLRGYNLREVFNKTSIYIVPMVNPDGVDLVLYWPNYTNETYRQAANLNTSGLPLPQVWKANIRGVDLNVNYPASWEKEKQLEIEQGITGPAPRDFGGYTPLSEPESRAMVDFTRRNNFNLVIAYHTQGEIIFWNFERLASQRTLDIANLFSRVSGYAVAEGYAEAAYAGYKDWFIQEFGRPGFTVEAGRGMNPLPISQFPEIYRDNEEILILGALV